MKQKAREGEGDEVPTCWPQALVVGVKQGLGGWREDHRASPAPLPHSSGLELG